MNPLVRTLAPAALALCALAAPAAAQQETAAFVVRLGDDTVSVEQVVRDGATLRGTMVGPSPRTTMREYVATLRPDGTLEGMTVTTRALAEPDAPPQTITYALAGDSAEVVVRRGDEVRTLRAAADAGVFPYVFNVWGITEHIVRWTRGRGDAVEAPILMLGAREVSTLPVARLGADSVLVTTFAGPARVAVDADGRILGATSPQSTAKFDVQRLPNADVQAVADAWLARERTRGAVGTLSPRDSVVAHGVGAAVSVAYGRPSMRGRQVMGGIVPYGQVWRTGANEATRFVTDRDLWFGDVRIPAGTYSLWTVPGPERWEIVFNRQSGQWGTQHDPADDFARVPATARPAQGPPVEQFTIRIVPLCEGGALELSWDRVVVEAPFVPAS